MFSDEILERIFQRNDVRKIPLSYQYTMIHAVEDVLREKDLIKEASYDTEYE